MLGEVAVQHALPTGSTALRSPERRELEYLRYIGASAETAKEIKLFGLGLVPGRRASGGWPRRSSSRTAGSPRSAPSGAACSRRSARLTYYGAYAYIVWRTVRRRVHARRPDLPRRLVPAPARAVRAAPDRRHPDRRPVALSRRPVLLLRHQADHRRAGRAQSRSRRRSARASSSRMSASAIPTPSAGRCATCQLHAEGRRDAGAGRRERRRQDHHRQAADPALRPRRGPHPDRRHRSARLRRRRSAHAISASSSRTSSATASPPPKTSASAASRPAATASASSRAAEQSLAADVIDKLPARLRPAARQAVRQRPRPVGRRMAEGGDRPRLYARGRDRSSSTSRPPRSTPRPRPKCSSASRASPAGKTAVLISHRFSTVRMADRILVLADGTHPRSRHA